MSTRKKPDEPNQTCSHPDQNDTMIRCRQSFSRYISRDDSPETACSSERPKRLALRRVLRHHAEDQYTLDRFVRWPYLDHAALKALPL
jgi:hypothetical protein